MHNKFVIQDSETDKWLSLDYHDGSTVIEVTRFTSAYPFDSLGDANKFMERERLDKSKHKVFLLQLSATPQKWV